ncbi:MAG: hypothetical protein HY898_32520 [Deltaproteobacteria bacterium]|nr:hypothetical protein [Deltaproteobacteria bacterium]
MRSLLSIALPAVLLGFAFAACGDGESGTATNSGGTAGKGGNDAAAGGSAGSKSGGASGGGQAGAGGKPDSGLGGSGAQGGSAGAAQGGAAGTSAGGSGGTAQGGAGGTAQGGAAGQQTGGCGPPPGGSGGAPQTGPCSFPQGVPDDGFFAFSCTYQETDPAVDADVNAVMATLSGCGIGSDCTITGFPGTTVDEICQSWFAAVTEQLRANGYCAGQHAVGSTDEIAVSNTGCTGKWYGYHICNYGGGKVVWNPGARRGWWMIQPQYCP